MATRARHHPGHPMTPTCPTFRRPERPRNKTGRNRLAAFCVRRKWGQRYPRAIHAGGVDMIEIFGIKSPACPPDAASAQSGLSRFLDFSPKCQMPFKRIVNITLTIISSFVASAFDNLEIQPFDLIGNQFFKFWRHLNILLANHECDGPIQTPRTIISSKRICNRLIRQTFKGQPHFGNICRIDCIFFEKVPEPSPLCFHKTQFCLQACFATTGKERAKRPSNLSGALSKSEMVASSDFSSKKGPQ